MSPKKSTKKKAAARGKRTRKTTKASPRKGTARKGSAPKAPSPTLAEVAEAYLAHLDERGATASTIASYRADLGVAQRELGADVRVAGITKKQVAAFDACAAVTRTRAGRAKAKPGVDRTRRVLRLALRWALEAGVAGKVPVLTTK